MLLYSIYAVGSKPRAAVGAAYLDQIPHHAFHLALLGRVVAHALLCAWPQVYSCTLPCLDKPAFQVPSLGKLAAGVEASVSNCHAKMHWLWCHMSDVSMQTCAPGNLHHQIQQQMKCRKWLHNPCTIVSDIHHRTVQGRQCVVGSSICCGQSRSVFIFHDIVMWFAYGCQVTTG